MTVYLVGAGPGNPDLLTIKAARLLAEAEVVVHDRLVSEQILEKVAPWAELINVGKDPNGERCSQQEINQILVEKGTIHRFVIRLKGGDPFVFGRGGEEAEAVSQAGIDVEIVPGITSAIAGPAAAGIPVTHRNVSSAFTVVTAHQDPDGPNSLNWDALACLGTTLVILMGARRAKKIRDQLLSGGMTSDTAVAVITSATTSYQEVDRLTLGELGENPISNPSIIIIGSVADEKQLAQMTRTKLTLEGIPTWL